MQPTRSTDGLNPIHPPPIYHATRCAAGPGGLTGCRLCVEVCPFHAIAPIPSSHGTAMHIDAGLCQRCGACTGTCPTSALERAFLPDGELYGHITKGLTRTNGGGPLLITCCDGERLVTRLSLGDAIVVLTLPSLLIVNETHLLHALREGASGVVLLGCRTCHFGRPALLDMLLQVTRALTGDGARLSYIEDDGTPAALTALQAFLATLPAAGDRFVAPTPSPQSGKHARRAMLAALLDGAFQPMPSAEIVQNVPFATVTIDADGCTLCGACSRVCPTKALDYDPARGDLAFTPLDCVNCGLCAPSCPERVLTLTPGLQVNPDLLGQRTLVADEVAPCQRCGRPYLPARLLAHVRTRLTEAVGPLPTATSQIDLCADCRSVAPEVPSARRTANGLDCNNRVENCRHGLEDESTSMTLLPLLGRRGFLRTAAATAMTSTLALLGKRDPGQAGVPAPGAPKRLAMAIDLSRCIGCHACTVACKAENNVPLGVFRDWVEEHQLGQYPHARPYFLPKLCNHCDDPGCLRSCPTGAIHRRPDGIVDLNHDICIGCRACNQACPYGATFMDPVRGTADKCNFCAHRVDQGLRPACVDICPTQCRIFGDLNDAESPISRYVRDKPTQVLRQELGLGPNVTYIALPGDLNR